MSSIVPIITLMVGAYMGHWWAVNRDRRKEFNDATERVRSTIKNQIKNFQKECYECHRVDIDELEAIENYMGLMHEKRFKLACIRYEKAIERAYCLDQSGRFEFIGDRKEVLESLSDLQHVLQRR